MLGPAPAVIKANAPNQGAFSFVFLVTTFCLNIFCLLLFSLAFIISYLARWLGLV